MGFKAFPHRLIVRIGDEAYRKLRQESRKAGYQVALVERWFLIPQDVGDLYSGIAAKEELHDMMHPELPVSRPAVPDASYRREGGAARYDASGTAGRDTGRTKERGDIP